MTRCCRTCRHSVSAGNAENSRLGYCRKKPPKSFVTGDVHSGVFPPVDLDATLCGEYRKRPWWWALTGRTA